MVKIKQGNLLEAKEDIICHQVNVQGYMGGGLAKQLANKYEGLEERYSEYCKNHNNRWIDLCGNIFLYKTKNNVIANMFSQEENFDTNYFYMKIALKEIKNIAKKENLTIAMPYGIGCRDCQGRLEHSL